MGRREHTSVSVSPGCHGNSCLTVEYPPVHRNYVVVDTSLFGCGGDDNVHHVLSTVCICFLLLICMTRVIVLNPISKY